MNNREIEKSIPHVVREINEYELHAVLTQRIINRSTGSISLLAFDEGMGLGKKTSPFDSFVQMIDGQAEVMINEKIYLLQTGDSIVLPAHISNCIKPGGRFKMIMTIIKSGYE